MRWHLPVRPGTQIALAYVNSLYNAPTEDRFIVTTTGFELTEVRSTSDAVLDSNGLPAPYGRDGLYFVSRIRRPIPFFTIRIGPVGRQRLVVGNSDVPLYTVGTGNAVTVVLRREPLLMRIARRVLVRGRS